MESVLISNNTIESLNEALNIKLPSRSTTISTSDILEDIQKLGLDSYVEDRMTGTTILEDSPEYIELFNYRGSAFYKYAVKGNIILNTLKLTNAMFVESSIASLTAINAISAGDKVFYNCSNLNSLTLPKLKSIISGYFIYGTKIASIEFPELEYIELCTDKMTSLDSYIASSYIYTFISDSTTTNINLPKLTTIRINENRVNPFLSNERIELRIFTTKSLKNLSLPKLSTITNEGNEFADKTTDETVTLLGATTSALTNINLPELSTVHIKKNKYNSLTNELVSTNTPLLITAAPLTGVTIINLRSFTDNLGSSNSISSVSTPPTICISSSSTAPSALSIIDLGCSSLNSYSIYNGNSSISTLVAIILRNEDAVCTINGTSNSFINSLINNDNCYIYVPQALIEDYKVATNWATVADKFRAIEDYPDIVNYSME